MSIKVLLRDQPHRTLALATNSHALIFRHAPSGIESAANGYLSTINSSGQTQTQSGPTPRCIAGFADLKDVDQTEYRSMSAMPVLGTLGLITVNNDVFLCVVSGSVKVATVRPGETVQRIHTVEFHCLNSSEYDHVSADDDDLARDGLEHPCLALKKLLSDGTFYYSTDFDLTNRLQERSADNTMIDPNNLDEAFFWNSYMIGPLVKFRSRLTTQERETLDDSRLLTSVIRGFALTVNIPPSTSPTVKVRTGLPSTLTVISRLSCRRAGTRFHARGIDDDGNVANFVETETIYWASTGLCFSYAQIRGSVPVFWEQATGLLPGQQKIQLTRSAEATQPAFDKHVHQLGVDYGTVHVLNLLSETKPGEADLTERYRRHVRRSPLNQAAGPGTAVDHRLLKETEFDFHAETKGPAGYEAASLVRLKIADAAFGFAYYLSEEADDAVPPAAHPQDRRSRSSVVLLQQQGVFRTNCLDCLDRTNLIQTIISQMAMESFLDARGERAAPDFWMRHSSLWADNGDSLSKIYAGTGALKSSFTRHGKMSLSGAIADARKSATRMYINNFADKGRQNTIDQVLGRLVGQTPVHLYDPINDYVTSELSRRSAEFACTETIGIWVGTFNLNGKTTGLTEDLSSWLCPDVDGAQQDPEIVAVAFQEIVELSPQQIMSTDPAARQAWEKAVKRSLNENAKRKGKSPYAMLRSEQLVGAVLSIFVKSTALHQIRNVEGSIKKTGLSGTAGNKGAVAIRLDYANTPICFVTAHLTAGFANYEDRNRDYQTINQGLRFQRDRGIPDHETVIWLGDFNYRIGLSDERVRKLIAANDLDALYENDQLNLQMVAGLTFPFYSESRITFPPTYKYDAGTDHYDSSEKHRIPAYCDRILRRGPTLRQIHYADAPQLKFSDHRPVYGTFLLVVSVIDEGRKAAISQEVYARRRDDVGRFNTRDVEDTEDEDLIGYEAIEPGLPSASSDGRKWWLDGGAGVRAIAAPPVARQVPNTKRESNPFRASDEPDWVNVSRPGTSPPTQRKVAPPPPPPSASRSSVTRLPTFDPPPRRPVATSPGGVMAGTPTTTSGETSMPSSPRSSMSPRTSKPPIPKKPTTLSSELSPTRSSSNQPTRQISSQVSSSPQTNLPYFPPPPRRATTAESRSNSMIQSLSHRSATIPIAQRNDVPQDEAGPKLPPRRQGSPNTQTTPSKGREKAPTGLMDEPVLLDPGTGGWEVLKPS